MNVTSTSNWTLRQNPDIKAEDGVSPLVQFASTAIPQMANPSAINSVDALQSALKSATGLVRRLDLCQKTGKDQSGDLKIIPFSQIPNFVLAGDVVSFVTLNDTPDWQKGTIDTMIKQRGWHAEIIAPKQGKLIQRGQWYGEAMVTPIEDPRKHPHYGNWPSYWNLDFFRFSPPKSQDNARFSSLIQGLEAWGNVFPNSTWPPGDASRNPVMFSNTADLMKLGDFLVQKAGSPPNMVCIEWVHAVFCLACCYPLTKKFLSDRKMLDAFNTNFPGFQFLDDSLEPFDTLPWAPYAPSYIIRSFLRTYFDEVLSDAVIDALPETAQLPSPVIMPIAPLLETREKGNPSNFDVTYVCTAVADELCVPQ